MGIGEQKYSLHILLGGKITEIREVQSLEDGDYLEIIIRDSSHCNINDFILRLRDVESGIPDYEIEAVDRKV